MAVASAKKYLIGSLKFLAVIAVTAVVTIWIERSWSERDKWDDLSEQTQRLVNVIVLADKDQSIAPPPYSASRLAKANFVKETQMNIHQEQWAMLSAQIPVLSKSSELSDWQIALSGHRLIEQNRHPGDFAVLEQKARWMALNQSYIGAPEASLPVRIVAYSGISKVSDSCDNCASAPTVAVKLPSDGERLDFKLRGYIVNKLPKGWDLATLPFVDLHKPEVANQLGTMSIDSRPKGRYFVPNSEGLDKIEQLGGEIKAFSSGSN